MQNLNSLNAKLNLIIYFVNENGRLFFCDVSLLTIVTFHN